MAGLTVTIPYAPRPYQREAHKGLGAKRFGVLVWHRRSGKTVAMINHLVRGAAGCTKPRPRFSYIAPLYSQAKQISWDYLKHYTAPIPGVKRNESELFVELPNGARVKLFGADNPDALRGLYHDGVVIDEPAQVKMSVWAEVVRPALADREGWAAFIGTPNGIDPFFELYHAALYDPTWYTSLLTVDDTGVISPEELELARTAPGMTEAKFRQEFYCDWTASSDDIFIPLDIVRPALGRTIQASAYEGAPVILAYDIARFGDDLTVGYKRQGLAAWQIREHQGLDTMTVAGLVAQDMVRHNPDAVFIDAGSMGAGVIDRLRQLGFKVTEVNFGERAALNVYGNKRAEMWTATKDWLRSGGCIPQDQRMAAELSSPRYKFDAQNRLFIERKEDMKKRGLASPNKADALALTFAHPVVPKHQANEAVRRAQAARQARQTNNYSVLGYR